MATALLDRAAHLHPSLCLCLCLCLGSRSRSGLQRACHRSDYERAGWWIVTRLSSEYCGDMVRGWQARRITGGPRQMRSLPH